MKFNTARLSQFPLNKLFGKIPILRGSTMLNETPIHFQSRDIEKNRHFCQNTRLTGIFKKYLNFSADVTIFLKVLRYVELVMKEDLMFRAA